MMNHRGTEHTEVAQRRACMPTFVQIAAMLTVSELVGQGEVVVVSKEAGDGAKASDSNVGSLL